MSQSDPDAGEKGDQDPWPPAPTLGEAGAALVIQPAKTLLGLRAFPVLALVCGIASLVVVPFTFLPVLWWDIGKLHYFCGNPRLEDQSTFHMSGIGPIAAAFFAPKTAITARDSWAKGIGIVSVVLFFGLAIVDAVLSPH